MRRLRGWLILPLLLSSVIGQSRPSAPQRAIVIRHVTVIDTSGAAARPDMTVLILGNRISSIAKSDGARIPKEAQVVDGTGRFLIPGLWDMHVHPSGKEYLTLFIANGVTGIRIMWGSPEDQEWRKQIEAGQLVGPRMVIASPIIDGPKPYWRGSISVATEQQARQTVDEVKKAGADFVKVYQLLPREEYFAIADEARKQAIPFEGHVPISVTAQEASQAGQKSFEHLVGILPAIRNSRLPRPRSTTSVRTKLIGLGYVLIHMKKFSDAIAIFKLSTEAYPESYNTWDSLAEAYMDNGDKQLAIQNYEKSLQINPGSTNGIEMLKKLKSQ
jgi:TolA-binding protein